MSFAVGSLVHARGREWVVLPDSSDDLVVVRPLGGSDDEVTAVLTALEPVRPARFALPDPSLVGDHRSAGLLRDALRLGFRASAGPFRSFGHLGVEPRPYQLVPLLMALRLDPVRLLIADDVGVGKTIEAGLVARELLDQGDARRLAVLCPPHLAQQWQAELAAKFHLEAELVLPATAGRLERGCGVGQTLFEVYRHVVISTDYIKSERRRGDFVRTCPELVIVDEAHTCAQDHSGRGGRQQRHTLLKALAADPSRHLILLSATPHSGKEDPFRSLLSLLDPEFAHLPEDLSGTAGVADRRRLARHFVQRRRGDIEHYQDVATPFPKRQEREEAYTLTPDYKRLFERVLAYARESVQDAEGGRHHQRVRWWSALALLRALASSPAAAAATLRTRAAVADTATIDEADALGRTQVLDLGDEEEAESLDVTPGADSEDAPDESARVRRRLNDLARGADALCGEGDAKLGKVATLLAGLLADGFRPIVFCRFIATADYLARALRTRLPKGVHVLAVTGTVPGPEREALVDELTKVPKRVLVATDCLAEGINLQEGFDAVVHYDLSWNPTRHEQRAGRVDRYGQPSPTVRVLTYYGTDNQIDGIVLDVLLRKHRAIRSSLGISIPVPGDANAVVEAILEGLLLRSNPDAGLEQLSMFEAYMKPNQDALFGEWEAAAEREKRSRTMFAQGSIKVEEVAGEVAAMRAAIGSGADVARFVQDAAQAVGGTWQREGSGGSATVRVTLTEAPEGVREAVGGREHLQARFEPPVAAGDLLLTRTHPVVEGLASYLLDTALDPVAAAGSAGARRCGCIRTRAVARRTTLLLVRYRFHLIVTRGGVEDPLLAEDCGVLAFAGPPSAPEWLPAPDAEALLAAQPAGNVHPDQAAGFVGQVVDGFSSLASRLDEEAARRGEALAQSHRRVRQSAGTGGRCRVEPQLPPDVLGIYLFLPVAGLH